MRSSLSLLSYALLTSVVGACAPSAARGMAPQARRPHAMEPSLDELARLEGTEGTRALLVVYPKSACSGSARMVFVDSAGTFFGAVGPGEAALLRVPSHTRLLTVISSIEVTAPFGVSSLVDEVRIPPSPSGVLLQSWRANARQCGSGQYANATLATKAELEATLAESEVQWVEPRQVEGQAWLDDNKRRMDELLGRRKAMAPAVVTRVRVP